MALNRRKALAALVGGGAALAGCLGGSSDDDSPDETDTGPSGNGATAGNSPQGTDDDPDGVPAPRSELPTGFSDGCPTYDNVVSTVCYDAVDAEELPVALELSTQGVTEEEQFEFTLHNRSDEAVDTNATNWYIHKYVDGEWVRIPRITLDLLYPLGPGESWTWRFTIENGAVENGESIPRWLAPPDAHDSDESRPLQGLGGGQYAFRARGSFANESYRESVAFATTFEVDAGSLALTTTGAITDTEWDGETLVAHSERVDPDEDRAQLGVFELERLDTDDENAERLITETLLRRDPRRDAFALAERHDADRVRIEEYNTTTPIFGGRSDGVFEYQGTHYEVTTTTL